MIRPLALAAMALAMLLLPLRAHAGPAAEAMSRCLVSSTDAQDHQALVRWILIALARHPDVAALATVDAGKAVAADRDVAAVFQRLLTDDCVAEARVAYREEQAAAFGAAFEALGKVAGESVFAHPQVNGAIQDMLQYVDLDLLQRALSSPPQ